MGILSRTGAILGGGTALLYCMFIGLPLVALMFKLIQHGGVSEALSGDFAVTALKLTLTTSAISMVLVVLVGTPFAYALARSNSRALKVLDSLVELPIVLPPVVAGVALLMAFGRQGVLGPPLSSLGINLPFTAAAVILAQVFVSAPFYVRAAKIGFQAVAREYEDISQTLGVSPVGTFLRLTAPLAGPSMVTGLALAWARAIAEFGATMMFAGNLTGKTQTLPLAIMTALQSNLADALALSLMLLAGAFVILLALGAATRREWQGRI